MNGAYTKFVEDAARLIYRELNGDPRIMDFQAACAHLESLHFHDAVSVICKGVKGGYTADFFDFGQSGLDADQMFRAAVSFARRRAKWTREGYLIAEFKSGAYFEAEGRRGWLDGATRDMAREYLKRYLRPRR